MIPVFFDTQQISEEYFLSESEINSLLDIAIKEIAASFARRWSDEAKSTLSSTRERYVESISVVEAGRLEGAVMLDYEDPVVRMVEEGTGAFDIKMGMERSNKRKQKKDGGWYMHIPFRVATPDAIGESDVFSFKMDEGTHEVAKQLDPQDTQRRVIKQADLPDKLSKMRSVRGGVTDLKTSKTYDEYVSKTAPSVGITKKIDEKTGQPTYMKFRTVSDVSDDNAFIHPGINAYNLAEKAESSFDSNMEYEINDALNVAFQRIGYGNT